MARAEVEDLTLVDLLKDFGNSLIDYINISYVSCLIDDLIAFISPSVKIASTLLSFH